MATYKKAVRPAQGAAGAPKPLSQQEQIAAISRGFTQQYQSIAQGVLFNLIHGYASAGDRFPDSDTLVLQALEITNIFMARVGPACDKAFDLIINKRPAADLIINKRPAAKKKEGE